MKTRRHLLIATAVLAPALLVLASCGRTSRPADPTPVSPQALAAQMQKAGIDVPSRDLPSQDFTLDSLGGGQVSLSSFKGKVVLLSFWATWCGPCKQEMPEMQALYEKLKPRGFEVVAVDMMEDKAVVADFVKKSGYTFPVLIDHTGAVGGAQMYDARAIPTNYIVDKNGKIVGRKIGVDGPTWMSPDRVAIFEALLSQ
ncbi:MAG TPA: TlpA disulfide reductase family protein [bacterium]|nr:TlpA disulfide reductase family protein [bacterium]